MPDKKKLYKQPERRDKGYSFSEGTISFGPKPEPKPNATALEKTGLTNSDPKEEAKKQEKFREVSGEQEQPFLKNEDGANQLPGVNAPGEETGPVNDSGQIDYSTDPKAAQQALIDKGYLKAGGADGKWGKGSQKALNEYYRGEGIVPPNAEKLDGVLKDLGVKVNSYAGLSEQELRNHPRGNKAYHIDGKLVEPKTSEVSSGGEVSPGLVAAAEQVLPDIKDLGLKVTGGNDAYHLSDEYYSRRMQSDFKRASGNWKKKRIANAAPGYKGGKPTVDQIKAFKAKAGKSKHTTGTNMDFQVSDPAAARKKFIAQGFVLKKGKPPKYVNPKTGVVILDEYAGKTGGGSGPHFHMEGVPDGHH